MTSLRTFYISYDGLLDPLGQSQIFPYVRRLSTQVATMTLLTFEKRKVWPCAPSRQAVLAELARCRIHWIPLRYHKWPPVLSTLYDMLRGLLVAWWYGRSGYEVIHCRGYVAAVIGAFVARQTGGALLFDMREFWVDGKVDGGSWKRNGWLYRLGKRCERWLLNEADQIVTLTECSAAWLRALPRVQRDQVPIQVIPTCVDLDRFHPSDNGVFGAHPMTVVYVGSIGTWYLSEEMVQCFRVIRSQCPGAVFRWLTPGPSEAIRSALRTHEIPESAWSVASVSHDAVAAELAQATISLFFIRPSFSKMSSCPTKVGESLACGVPLLTNHGIGDLDELITTHRIGVLVEQFEPDSYARAVKELRQLLQEGDGLRRRCRQVAERFFALEIGIRRYTELYKRVSERSCVG